MARYFVGVFRPGSSDGGGTRRNGEHHGIVGRERNRVVAELQFTDMVCRS